MNETVEPKKKANPIIIAGAVVVVLAIASAGIYVVGLRTQNDALHRTVDEQATQLAKLKRDVESATADKTDLQASLTLSRKTAQADADELERLKGSVDAFAKQAGACETVRQRLATPGNAAVPGGQS